MFARQVFRSAAPLKSQIRRYATDPPQSNRRNLYIGAGVGLVALTAFYFYGRDRAHKMSVMASNGQVKATAGKDAGAPPPRTEESNIPAQASTPSKIFTGGEQGFVPLTLDKVEQLSHNTKKFRFKFPGDDRVSGLAITSALITKFQPEGAKPVIRPYTPVSDESEKGYLDFVIKRYPNGPMTEHLHSMKPGDTLDMKGPIPKYPWSANKHEHVTLLAGGTGITPMYQLIRAIFTNPEDKTKVTLVFGNNTEEDILLKKELDDLENTYPRRFRVYHQISNPSEKWQGGKGRITQGLLKTVLPEPKEVNQKIFVCGPPGMYDALSGNKPNPAQQGELSGILKDLGYTADQVYKF